MPAMLSSPPDSPLTPLDGSIPNVSLSDVNMAITPPSDVASSIASSNNRASAGQWDPPKLTKKALAEMAACGPSKEYGLPYFSHQALDPGKYIGGVHLPVGGPSEGNMNALVVGETDSELEDDNSIHGSDLGDEGEYIPRPSRKVKNEVTETQSFTKGARPASYKNVRTEGGRPPLAKKVTANLDSDDEIIVRMKQAKYSEKAIAERLKAEGRISYQTKSISGRYQRIRKALQQKQDENLDADMTDWHDGDDEVLAVAVEKAEAEIERTRQRLEAAKWKMVADIMKNDKPVVDFSQNACRNRYESLQNGTAKPTPESILNPNADILARIESRIEKQKKIDETVAERNMYTENLEQNAWNSCSRRKVPVGV
ncbi:MAG: hypothetical protein Q9227_006929 [Pyrenula ochraceoflavens]